VSTNPENLKATLDQLHQELAQIDQVDPALREQLIQSLAEIQAALRNKPNVGQPSSGKTEKRESLVARLRDTARRFEETHPALAANIGGLIDTLGSSGI
jgi:hypothetical protein